MLLALAQSEKQSRYELGDVLTPPVLMRMGYVLTAPRLSSSTGDCR